jgi:hypothetical protein
VTKTAATSPVRSRLRPALRLAAPALLVLVALGFALPAYASNAALKRTLATWSHRLAVDAYRVSLSARHRHPRRMTTRARRFRHDALAARQALATRKPSSPKGSRAKRLGLAAFSDYAVVGRQWVLTGQARLQHRRLLAARHARIAKLWAVKANRLLVAAGRLLR